MLFSTLVKESYKSISEAENEELQTAIENVIVAKKLDKYKRASSITDDKFREAVQLVKDAVKNKFTDTEIKNALAKELYNMLPESERPSKKKVLRESEKRRLKESSLNDVMERWYDEDVDILPSQYADSYHIVLHNMQEVKEYNYRQDYWGTAEEYQENAERLMRDIEPYIGQEIDYDTDDGTIKVKVLGVDIDKQYNGHLAVRVDIVEEPVKEADGDYRTYEVVVDFRGYHCDNEYLIGAHSKADAVRYALDEPGSEAEMDLSVENIEDQGDGYYDVEVGFAGYIGCTNNYTVQADDEDEAEQLALEEAKNDLEIVSIDGEDFSYEDLNEADTELDIETKVDEPNKSITAEEFLDSTITVYDIADYVEHLVIGTSSVPYTTHTGPKRAILQDVNGKYIVADYEAVRDIADTENDDIPISVSKKPEEGSRTIPIFPEGTINLSVKELEEAPSEQMKARDFFTKYNYNPRCERNFDGLIKNLNGQY